MQLDNFSISAIYTPLSLRLKGKKKKKCIGSWKFLQVLTAMSTILSFSQLTRHNFHSLRQARSRQVTSSILRVLSVIEIPCSMMYMIFKGAPRENLFLIYVLSWLGISLAQCMFAVVHIHIAWNPSIHRLCLKLWQQVMVSDKADIELFNKLQRVGLGIE